MRLLILFLICSFNSYGSVPKQLLNVDPELYENADDVVLEERTNYVIHSTERAVKKHYRKILILNDESNDRGYYEAYDGFTKVTKLNAAILDLDGTKIEKFKKKDFHDYPSSYGELYSDSRVLAMDFERFKTPFIVEIESEIEYQGMLYYDIYSPCEYNQAVVQSIYTIEHPSSLDVRYKGFNEAPEPNTFTSGTTTTMNWNINDMEAVEPEAMGPYSIQLFPYVKILPSEFSYDDQKGNMGTWDSYNDFYYHLNVDRDQLSDEMSELVHQLVAEKENEVEKIDALYTYLKDNMRYISVQLGIGGWQTFDAAYVEKNKFGDCKALSNFMGAMLSEAGIESNKVIIKRGEEVYNPLSEQFSDPTLFNHAIVYVPSQDMFVECTSNNYPLGYIGNDNANKKVLISTPSGPKFVHTPKMGKNENTVHKSASIELLDSGGAHVKSENTYVGYRHDGLRAMLPRMTKDELDKRFQKSFPIGIEKLNSYTSTIIENEPKVKTQYDVIVAQYGSKAGKRLFIPLDGINSKLEVPPQVQKRKLPFYSIVEQTIEEEISITIPDGFEIEALPSSDFSEETEYGDFRLSIEQEENIIKVYKKWVSKVFEFPPEKYADYREKMKTFSSLDNSKIVLVKKKT